MQALQKARRPCALIAALIGWAALALQFYLTLGNEATREKPVIAAVLVLVSYFTILANLLAACCLSAAVFVRPDSRLFRSSFLAVTVYMVVVGVTYTLLLRNVWAPQGWQLVADILLHNVMPIVVPLYWLLFVPKGRQRWSAPLLWLIFPLAYFAVALLQGRSSGSYPYPFIDVVALGYPRVLLNGSALVLAFLVLAFALVWLDHRLGSN